MSWCWELGDERYLVAVNFSGTPSQAVIRMPWDDLRGRTWRLSELLSENPTNGAATRWLSQGSLCPWPWRWHFFRLAPDCQVLM